MNRLYSVVILLLIQVYAFNCQESQKNYLTRDFSVTLVIDDHEVDLEAYHSKENEEILIESNPNKYRKLKWLTKRQKIMIINEIKKIHNVSVEMNQIVELNPDNLECELELIGDSEEESSIVKGKVKSFKLTPLRVEFEASSDEIKWMRKYLSERKEDIQIVCGIGSDENGFKSKNFKLGLQLNKPVKL